ncbi:unnamed protein product [Anisakis simplex]|uniref:Active regulator of SIRT1 n=1 Tax=Anisakis simplex TaxID=6269 RepID=A0A0M3KB99_ANISI|nr:unnamed protein product [Anisakis simplex]
MSVDLLRKSLSFIEEEDGISASKKLKRVSRISPEMRERQRIRALAGHLEFDCDRGDFVEATNAKHSNSIKNEWTPKPCQRKFFEPRFSTDTLAPLYQRKFLLEVSTAEMNEISATRNRNVNLKGVSLVEQHRSKKRVNLLKRNIKYMVYTNEKKLDTNRVDTMISMMSRRERDMKQIRRELLKENDGVREPDPFKQKKEVSESVFTDDDFMKIAPDRAKVNSRITELILVAFGIMQFALFHVL